MNVWDLLGQVLGWVFLVVFSIMAVVLVLAILVGVLRGIRKWPNKRMKYHEFIQEAEQVGDTLYKEEIIMPKALALAFKTGARWAWGAHRRK